MELDLTGIHQLAAEQGIDTETLDEALAEALRQAYLKTPHAAKHARVELDDRAGTFTVWAQDEIAEPQTDNAEIGGSAEEAKKGPVIEGAAGVAQGNADASEKHGPEAAATGISDSDSESGHFVGSVSKPSATPAPESHTSATTVTPNGRNHAAFGKYARDARPVVHLGEEYDDTPNNFGRLAAATARQVISQLFRDAEDNKIFGAFSGQKGKLVTGIIQQDANDASNVHVAVGETEALLPKREQIPGERYRHGDRIRVYVVNVARGLKGPEIIVSRSHPELVRRLFEREVPELASGAVSIMAIAREAGARTKIAVRANTQGVNPKGALIGPGGARVRAVMENLGLEKIDIVDWSADPAKFVAAALSPAVATQVNVISEKNKTAIAFIHDDQLSLAIGKEGQNARLSAKLTGWKIGIESAEAHEQQESSKGAEI
ncbi:transcription termination factor NusA [Bifidobacterium sp.]|uniref:transcription termination factor NusA n=1 Tax=Bifidobacterium sp. TaxID=41200 RepID=UPI0039E9E037